MAMTSPTIRSYRSLSLSLPSPRLLLWVVRFLVETERIRAKSLVLCIVYPLCWCSSLNRSSLFMDSSRRERTRLDLCIMYSCNKLFPFRPLKASLLQFDLTNVTILCGNCKLLCCVGESELPQVQFLFVFIITILGVYVYILTWFCWFDLLGGYMQMPLAIISIWFGQLGISDLNSLLDKSMVATGTNTRQLYLNKL